MRKSLKSFSNLLAIAVILLCLAMLFKLNFLLLFMFLSKLIANDSEVFNSPLFAILRVMCFMTSISCGVNFLPISYESSKSMSHLIWFLLIKSSIVSDNAFTPTSLFFEYNIETIGYESSQGIFLIFSSN